MGERTLEEEIADHAMNPKYYGELKDADGVGVGIDPSGIYMLFYINVADDVLHEIAYATSGSQDATTLGSLLSDMVKGDTLTGVHASIQTLEQEVEALYQEKEERIAAIKAAGAKTKISMKEQDSAAMVLAALKAALQNRENRLKGIEEEQHRITIEDRGGDNVKKGCAH